MIEANKIPDQYKEGIVTYNANSIDGIPQWPQLMAAGYTWNQHLKLNALYAIEHAKSALEEYKDSGELSLDEISEVEKLIQDKIKEYNEMEM